MWLFLEALDVWMFRDGKPFTAGEGHVAVSHFPPSAHTLQGALRAFLLDYMHVDIRAYRRGQAPDNIHALLGDPSENSTNLLGTFSLRGPFVARRYNDGTIERYVSLPQDVVIPKTEDIRSRNARLRTLQLTGEYYTLDGLRLHNLDVAPDDEYPKPRLWLPEDRFQAYLNGAQLTVDDCVREETLFVREYRTGNALDYSVRRVQEGMLYSAAFIRLQPDVGLLVWLEDDLAQEFPDEGFLRLGGEGRSARFEKLIDSTLVLPSAHTPPDWQVGKQIKIVFLTPAYFTNGWLPAPDEFRWLYEAIRTVVIDRPLCISGWNLALRRPRPVRRYVPVGSVYYLDIQTEWPDRGTLLCEQPPGELPLHQLGFGDVAVGIW